MAECEICKRSPFEVPLFRINEAGIEGIFRCTEHLPPNRTIIADIVTAIAQPETWIIVAKEGYFVGGDRPAYSKILREITNDGYFESEAAAIAHASKVLPGKEIKTCKVLYSDPTFQF